MTTPAQPAQPAQPRKSRRSQESSAPESAGAEGLAVVPEATRGGEDVRRRGWFWHWNALVTQYSPLIGLKGVGLLNSYTVWTDRREESPHRGYAFPSQQSEADFYGEDRAELITINKILVALDLIEIRKEMVLRADAQGRRWKVPHNFYRVKDHGDDFTLSTGDVLRVAELAERDRAVYRYVRRVFSPRFSPIDGDNVWARILPEVRQTPVWQTLAQRAAKEEDRASARTRAGHAARKGSAPEEASPESRATTPFFVASSGDDAANTTVANDSASVTTPDPDATSVAAINTGAALGVAPVNTGSARKRPSRVGDSNSGQPTSVDPSNTTYHQPETTTKRVQKTDLPGEGAAANAVVAGQELQTPATAMTGGPATQPPDDAAGQAAALRAFEHANDRASTPAERKLLRDLAERFAPAASRIAPDADAPRSGWGWLEAAVWEAVEAGSAFVAPRRLREILLRWERDGFPGAGAPDRDPDPEPTPPSDRPKRQPRDIESAPAAPLLLPVTFTIAEVGLSNRQVWAAALAELAQRGEVSKADLHTWLHPASLIGREGDTLILAAPHAVARDRIIARLLPAVRDALCATIGLRVDVAVVVEGDRGRGGKGDSRTVYG